MSNPTAEQLDMIRRIVSWTLWNIGTTEPNCDTHAEKMLIQGHGQSLFADPDWIAQVVTQFASHHFTTDDRYAWDNFIEAMKEKDND